WPRRWRWCPQNPCPPSPGTTGPAQRPGTQRFGSKIQDGSWKQTSRSFSDVVFGSSAPGLDQTGQRLCAQFQFGQQAGLGFLFKSSQPGGGCLGGSRFQNRFFWWSQLQK